MFNVYLILFYGLSLHFSEVFSTKITFKVNFLEGDRNVKHTILINDTDKNYNTTANSLNLFLSYSINRTIRNRYIKIKVCSYLGSSQYSLIKCNLPNDFSILWEKHFYERFILAIEIKNQVECNYISKKTEM